MKNMSRKIGILSFALISISQVAFGMNKKMDRYKKIDDFNVLVYYNDNSVALRDTKNKKEFKILGKSKEVRDIDAARSFNKKYLVVWNNFRGYILGLYDTTSSVTKEIKLYKNSYYGSAQWHELNQDSNNYIQWCEFDKDSKCLCVDEKQVSRIEEVKPGCCLIYYTDNSIVLKDLEVNKSKELLPKRRGKVSVKYCLSKDKKYFAFTYKNGNYTMLRVYKTDAHLKIVFNAKRKNESKKECVKNLRFSSTSKYLLVTFLNKESQQLVCMYDIFNKSTRERFKTNSYKLIKKCEIVASEKYLLLITNNTNVNLFDIKSGKSVINHNFKKKVFDCNLDSKGNYLLVRLDEPKFKEWKENITVYNLFKKNRTVLSEWFDKSVESCMFLKCKNTYRYVLLKLEDQTVKLFDLYSNEKDQEILKYDKKLIDLKINGRYVSMIFDNLSKDGEKPTYEALVLDLNDNCKRVFNKLSSLNIKRFDILGDRYLYFVFSNGTVKLFDLKNKEKEVVSYKLDRQNMDNIKNLNFEVNRLDDIPKRLFVSNDGSNLEKNNFDDAGFVAFNIYQYESDYDPRFDPIPSLSPSLKYSVYSTIINSSINKKRKISAITKENQGNKNNEFEPPKKKRKLNLVS